MQINHNTYQTITLTPQLEGTGQYQIVDGPTTTTTMYTPIEGSFISTVFIREGQYRVAANGTEIFKINRQIHSSGPVLGNSLPSAGNLIVDRYLYTTLDILVTVDQNQFRDLSACLF